MKRFLLAFVTTILVSTNIQAQSSDHAVYKNSLWQNWYVQAGLDMALQNPNGYPFFKEVFPNGKTFGIDAAAGKWFTPEIGLRVKLNWENGIGLFRNNHANWLAPMNEPGVNLHRGGYIYFVGDIQLDIHNLIWGYKADRLWNLQIFPRAGVGYNFGAKKGTPIVAIGLGNTFRINEKYKIYFDIAYHGVSSGFIPVPTDTGSEFNAFMDINVGLQINLGTSTFRKASK